MDIKQAIRTVLVGDATLTALVGTRIYGGKLPQLITASSIVFRLYDVEDIEILAEPGVSNLTKSFFRFGCVVRGDENEAYDVAADIDIALRAVLQGLHGHISDGESPETTLQIVGARRLHASDFYDDPTETHWVRSDWEISHALA